MRMTKIVCTMGPACDDVDTLVKMINAGMNVARFNMSHGEYDAMTKRFDRVKEAIAKAARRSRFCSIPKAPRSVSAPSKAALPSLSRVRSSSSLPNPAREITRASACPIQS